MEVLLFKSYQPTEMHQYFLDLSTLVRLKSNFHSKYIKPEIIYHQGKIYFFDSSIIIHRVLSSCINNMDQHMSPSKVPQEIAAKTLKDRKISILLTEAFDKPLN